MARSWRSWLMIPACLAVLVAGSLRLPAEEGTLAPEAGAPGAAATTGCPHAAAAQDCANCPNSADCPCKGECPHLKAKAAEDAPDCPCKHAQQGEDKKP